MAPSPDVLEESEQEASTSNEGQALPLDELDQALPIDELDQALQDAYATAITHGFHHDALFAGAGGPGADGGVPSPAPPPADADFGGALFGGRVTKAAGRPAERDRSPERRRPQQPWPPASRGRGYSACSTKFLPLSPIAIEALTLAASKFVEQGLGGHKVHLHVYHLDPVTARLNDSILGTCNLGAFHCGVEVLNREWYFGWRDSSQSGVIHHEPGRHRCFVHRESVSMGRTPLSEAEIMAAIKEAQEAWPGNTYHPITRNCVTFCEELLSALRVPEQVPEWVRGAADAGRMPVIFPLVDVAWQCAEWCYSSQSRPGAVIRAPDCHEAVVACEMSVQFRPAKEAVVCETAIEL